MSRLAARVVLLLSLLSLPLLLAPLPLFGQAAPVCDVSCGPNTSSPSYGGTLAARPTLPNARGSSSPIVPRLAGPPVAPSPIPARPVNEGTLPGSESYNYAIPILRLPGRNGLDLNLTLYYNSRVWTIDLANGTATFDADRDWPSYGFRLNFGYLEHDTTNDQWILTEADGTKRTLLLTGTSSYDSNDGAYVHYDSANKVVFYKSGLELIYEAFPQAVTCKLAGQPSNCTLAATLFRPVWIADTNGNAIGISYVDASANAWSQGQDMATITDTLGRVVTFNYDSAGKLLSITQGSKTWATFTWNTAYTLNYNFSLTVPNDTDLRGKVLNVLTACTYPNGVKYGFGYGDWAIVNQIVKYSAGGQTRSSVSYNFPAASAGPLPGHPTYTQQTVFDGVNTATWGYSVTKSGSLVSSLTVSDPAGTGGTKTVTTLSIFTGLLSQVQVQNSAGTPLRTQAYTWTTDPAGYPQIGTVLSTLNDTGQQSKVTYTYTYTTNGNVSELDEYGYGLALARKTLFTYLTVSPSWLHILDRVTQVKVETPASGVVARTDLAYDGAALISVTGAYNHNDGFYGASMNTRGNLTSVTRYANAAAGTGAITRSFTYDSLGNLRSAQLDCCNQKTWSYSLGTQYAYPDSVTSGPTGGPQLTTSATYNTSTGLVVSSTDANGQVTNFSYIDPVTALPDTMNRVRKVTRPDGVSSSVDYDDSSALASATSSSSANSLVTVSTLDGAGREIERDVKNGTATVSTVRTSYDILGRVASRTNPYGPSDTVVSTSYAYDALGRVTTITPPSGGHSTFEYSGNAVTFTDPAGNALTTPQPKRRSFTDALGRLVEVDEPGWGDGLPGKGSVTISGSDPSVTNDPCLDSGGNPCPHTIWDSGTVSLTVNGFTKSTGYGRSSTASGLATALANAFNGDASSPVSVGVSGSTLLLTAKVANGSTNYPISYSSRTNDTSHINFADGAFPANLSGPTLTGARDPSGPATASLVTPMVTTYSYDVLDDLTGVSQAAMGPVGGQQLAGQPRSYAYDGLGRLTASTTPESGTTQFFYTTAAGAACAASAAAVCRKTDARGITSTYSYDGLNRVVGVSYSDSTPPVSYAYDAGGAGQFALGRLTSVTVGSGSPALAAESYTYDLLGRITQAQESVGGANYPVGYSYNQDNTLASITYPSGRVVAQSYDGMGRLTTIASGTTNYLSGLAYNAAGQATAFNYGNGVAAAFSYNDHLQLATLEYSKTGAADLLSLAYDYMLVVNGATVNNGQIQKLRWCTAAPSLTCTDDPTRTENFSYDAWGRLSAAGTGNGTSWGLSWNYDRFGNRLNQNVTAGQAPAPSVSVDAATNRINSAGYAYDAAGNMTNDAANTYSYDAENRITQVGAGLATYTYLGALRVERQFGGTTIYVYSGTVPIAEYAAGAQLNQPNKEYIYSGSQLLATIDATNGTSYQFPDHLSTRVEADANATITRTFGHFPFGETWYETGTPSKWKFASYERDSESALDYAQFRLDSSRLGRFMSPDFLAGSVGSPESLDRYTYAGNDPVNLADPSGLRPCYFDSNGNCVGGSGGNCMLDSFTQIDCGFAASLASTGAAFQGPLGFGDPFFSGSWTAYRVDANGVVWQYVPGPQPTDCYSSAAGSGVEYYCPGTWVWQPVGTMPTDPGEAWWSTFTQTFVGGTFSVEGLKAVYRSFRDEDGCDHLLVTTLGTDLIPVPTEFGPTDVVEPAAKLLSGLAYSQALSYAATKGLIYPLKSSVFRGLLDFSEGVEASVPAVAVVVASGHALGATIVSAVRGECH